MVACPKDLGSIGHLIFIRLTNDLKSDDLLLWHIDDSTVSEIFNKYENSKTNVALSAISQWSERNNLNTNCSKTSEIKM